MAIAYPKSVYVAIFAAAAPVFVLAWLFLAIPWALTGGSLVRAYFVMAIAFTVLLASAIALYRSLVRSRLFVVAAVGALATVLVVWVWQRIAFNVLIPNHFLEYGYFLKGAEGSRARFLFLELPFTTGSVILLLQLVAAVVGWWRLGARWLCLVLPLWWAALFALFSLPYVAWSIQGDASVFI
ncbi:MAG TPA: hypothetical protein VLV78_18585 [Thermoanaerobaculia bacterium]|nr:hypothetical protein [Thermoanaerobaculia bacterium]